MPMQAWRSFSLAGITLGRGPWHDTTNGAATDASAVKRKNSRRDSQDGGTDEVFMFSVLLVFMFSVLLKTSPPHQVLQHQLVQRGVIAVGNQRLRGGFREGTGFLHQPQEGAPAVL